uniref:Tripartite motif-containing protein 29-like n=1 Tax=Petromyzon marinus TaxID=7757 RepID=A0AAJ7XJW6_PETMA|nr:tripartite motif-containing protein 29-like [Petromyzon marinus]
MMASAAPSDSEAPGELICLICREIDTSSCCPKCRVTFPQRPQLKDVAIAKLAEECCAGGTMATMVWCNFCSDGTTAATNTCFKCKLSYCAAHILPDLGRLSINDHIVVHPGRSSQERKCKEQRKELELFRKQDKKLVCRTCTTTGDHRGHNVATQDEREPPKKQVREEKRAVEEKKWKAKEYVSQMEAARREVKVPCLGRTLTPCLYHPE